MTWQDSVNGLFEFLAGFAILNHCYTLHRDKQIRGVSVLSTLFFTSWGYWNLYYYPHLNQWASFAGGLSIVTANTLWIGMMWYYMQRERLERWNAMKSWRDEHGGAPSRTEGL